MALQALSTTTKLLNAAGVSPARIALGVAVPVALGLALLGVWIARGAPSQRLPALPELSAETQPAVPALAPASSTASPAPLAPAAAQGPIVDVNRAPGPQSAWSEGLGQLAQPAPGTTVAVVQPIAAPAPPNAPPSVTSAARTAPVSVGAAPGFPPTAVPVLSISTPGQSSAILSRAGVVPGDSWSYNLLVRNDGLAPFSYWLTSTPMLTSGLDDPAAFGLDPAGGLRLTVSRCASGFGSCTALYDGPVKVDAQTMGRLAAGADDYVQLTVRFLSASGNEFQNLSSALNLTWTATQAS